MDLMGWRQWNRRLIRKWSGKKINFEISSLLKCFILILGTSSEKTLKKENPSVVIKLTFNIEFRRLRTRARVSTHQFHYFHSFFFAFVCLVWFVDGLNFGTENKITTTNSRISNCLSLIKINCFTSTTFHFQYSLRQMQH